MLMVLWREDGARNTNLLRHELHVKLVCFEMMEVTDQTNLPVLVRVIIKLEGLALHTRVVPTRVHQPASQPPPAGTGV